MNPNKAKAWVGGASFVTASLVAFWTQLEGTRSVPYRDIAGVLTVCSGHTGPDVVPGVKWSKAECDRVTIEDLTKFGLVVIRCVQTPLTRGQFEALVVFAGNVGEWAFCESGLAKRLNDGDFKAAEAEFRKWVYVGCSVKCRESAGLLNRRMAELARFKERPTQLARGSSIFRLTGEGS